MKIILISLFFSISLFAQRADFYDTYNYDMRNMKLGDSGDGVYRDYDQPPKFQKPALVNPKSVQRQPDISSLLQGQTSIRSSNNQSQNPVASQTSNLPIDPVTGRVNPDAIARQREKERQSKEKKRQFLNREIEPYTETRGRRMEIIFLTTFPFAAAFSAGITILYGRAIGNFTFIKTTQAFFMVILGATGLSAANMMSDIRSYDEYMKNKKETNPLPPSPPEETQSQLYKGQVNYSFSLVFGQKNF